MVMSQKNENLDLAQTLAASISYTKKEIAKLNDQLASLQQIVEEMDNAHQAVVLEEEAIPGPQGERGPKGDKGDKGEKGDIGLSGPVGPTGPQGEKGEKGDSGPQGEQGPKGEEGQVGPQGLKGDKGDKGDRGEVGPQGIQGEKGDRGEKGEQGVQGVEGRQGPRGDVGPQGIQGLPGEKGETGERGERGEKGEQGIRGPKGEKGDQGDQGLRGEKGEKGDKGDPGETPSLEPLEEKFEQLTDKIVSDVTKLKREIANKVTSKFGNRFALGDTSGGGEVRLLRLDDVDTTNLGNNRFLRYNSTSEKLEFVAVSPGGVSDFNQLTGQIAEDQIPNNAISISKFVNDVPYTSNTYVNTELSLKANTTQLSRYLEVANASSITPETLDKYLEVANSTSFLFANNIIAGNNISISTVGTNVTISSTATGGTANVEVGETLNVKYDNDNGLTYRVVAIDANSRTILASSKNIDQINRVAGILDDDDEVVTFGVIENLAWSWANNQNLFLGENGQLSTTSTIDGGVFTLQIGSAISATKVFVKLGTPVAL